MEDTAGEVALDVLGIVAYAAFGLVIGALASILIGIIVRLLMRRRTALRPFARRFKTPIRVVSVVLGSGLGVLIATGEPDVAASLLWRPYFLHGYMIALIFSGAYLTTALIHAVQDSILEKRDIAQDTVHSRRLRTQAQVVGRVGIVGVWVIAIAGALLTFEEFRAVGASLLASAGLLSIVAGLAAQTSLANIFAGVQLAFTDALRVGDLVIVDDNWGSIEEITLTYVVVASWDGRRWIVPSTVFISKTFESWTRLNTELLGTVEFDLDWLAPIEAIRIELQRIVRRSDLWDGRQVSLQITDATGGHVKLRAVVSAATSGELWDLRCFVREEMISWLQHNALYALPRTRLEPEPTAAPPTDERDEFIEQMRLSWEEERSDEPTQELNIDPLLEDAPTADVAAAGHRRWFQAIRNRRSAKDISLPVSSTAEVTELIASVLRDSSKAKTDESAKDVDDEQLAIGETDGRGDSLSSTARMFSGSPEGDELNRRYSGPGATEIAERQEWAKRNSTLAPSEALPRSSDGEDS